MKAARCLFPILAWGCACSAFGQDMKQVIDGLKATKSGLQSVEIKEHARKTLEPYYFELYKENVNHKVSESEDTWAFKGTKFASRWTDTDGMNFVRIGDAKGSTTYKEVPGEVRYFQSSKSKAVHVEDILDFGFRVQGEWLADLLGSGSFKVAGHSTDPKFGDIVQITGELPKKMMQVSLSLAPKFGWLAVNYEIKVPNIMRQTFEIEETQVADGITFPVRVVKHWFMVKDGKDVPYMSDLRVVSDVRVNSVDDSVFTAPKSGG